MIKENIKDLITAIATGNTLDIETTFNDIMAHKISDRLDDMRGHTAKSMFGADQVNEELELEDFSIEELQDYMMSEEFEQLDELSKQTLGSYIKSATHDVADKSRTAATKLATGKDSDYGSKEHIKSAQRTANISRAVNKLIRK